MNILFITQLLPYPARTGGTTKTLKILSYLARNHNVSVATFHDSDDGVVRAKQLASLLDVQVVSIYRPEVTRPSKMTWAVAFKSLFSIKPFRIYKYFDSRLAWEIQLFSKQKQFDCVYCDHDTSFQYVRYVHGYRSMRVIYDEHNIDSIASYRSALWSNRMILTRMLFLWDAIKYWMLERYICLHANKIACISEVDKQLLERRGGNKNALCTLPIPYTTKKLFTYGNRTIMFVGLMSWSPNKLGFQWFVDTVYPLVRAQMADVSLVVVGGRLDDDTHQYAVHDSTIRFVGEVPETKKYYPQAGVVIVPIHLGGGIRIKLLEALSYGMPVVSTTLGAEGIISADDLTSPALLADTSKQFADAVISLLNKRSQANLYSQRGLNFIKRHYSQIQFTTKMRDLLGS